MEEIAWAQPEMERDIKETVSDSHILCLMYPAKMWPERGRLRTYPQIRPIALSPVCQLLPFEPVVQ